MAAVKLCVPSLHDRYEKWMNLFHMSQSKSQMMCDAIIKELQLSLEIHAKDPNGDYDRSLCSFMSLDCCVDKIPNGSEKGVYYAVDLGGTNLRAVRIHLKGDGTYDIKQVKESIRNDLVSEDLPKGLLDKKATASQLFDGVANRVQQLMATSGDKSVDIGFTFSFGLKQLSLNQAILLCWTKGFETGMDTNDPVIGRDVCSLLDAAFHRRDMDANTVASLNDTTGTLLAAAYEKPRKAPHCMIGVILGTGFNACYVDKTAPDYKYQGTVINCEAGNFNKCLPETPVDLEVDFESTAPGTQRLEKMLAGLYLGEICRHLIIRVFQRSAPEAVWVTESMPTEACAAIYNDDTMKYTKTQNILKTHLDWHVTDEKELRIIYKCVCAVFERSASLAAVVIGALAKKTKRLQPAMGGLTVGIDGTLYTQNPKYQKCLRKQLEKLLGQTLASLVHITVTSDGSGKGAAVLAGTLAN